MDNATNGVSQVDEQQPLLRTKGSFDIFQKTPLLKIAELLENDEQDCEAVRLRTLAHEFLYHACKKSVVRNGLYENNATLQPHNRLEEILQCLGKFIQDLTVDYSGCSDTEIENIAQLVRKHCPLLSRYRLHLFNQSTRHVSATSIIPILTECEKIEVYGCKTETDCYYNNDPLLSKMLTSAPALIELNICKVAVQGWFLASMTSHVRKLKLILLQKFVGCTKSDFDLRDFHNTTPNLCADQITLEFRQITDKDIATISLSTDKCKLKVTNIESDVMNNLLKDFIFFNKVRHLQLSVDNQKVLINDDTSHLLQFYTSLRTLQLGKSFLTDPDNLPKISQIPNLKRLVCKYSNQDNYVQHVTNATNLLHNHRKLQEVAFKFGHDTNETDREKFVNNLRVPGWIRVSNPMGKCRSVVLEKANSDNRGLHKKSLQYKNIEHPAAADCYPYHQIQRQWTSIQNDAVIPDAYEQYNIPYWIPNEEHRMSFGPYNTPYGNAQWPYPPPSQINQHPRIMDNYSQFLNNFFEMNCDPRIGKNYTNHQLPNHRLPIYKNQGSNFGEPQTPHFPLEVNHGQHRIGEHVRSPGQQETLRPVEVNAGPRIMKEYPPNYDYLNPYAPEFHPTNNNPYYP